MTYEILFGFCLKDMEGLATEILAMNIEKFDRQTIFEYLLGTLDESDEMRFDELSITDDEFADALAAAENDLIDAHVRGELDQESSKQFESHYLTSPRRREKTDFARALQVFAETNDTKTETRTAPAGIFSAVRILFAARPLQFGFAMAAIVVLILSGWWFFASRRAAPEMAIHNTPSLIAPPQSDGRENTNEVATLPEKSVGPHETGNAPANKRSPDSEAKVTPTDQPLPVPQVHVATLILRPPLRGSNQMTNLPISREITEVAVTLQLDANEFPAYRISLNDESGKNIRRSGTLHVDGNSLNFRFPGSILRSGVYSLIVSGIKNGDAQIISSYSFRSVIK